MKTHAKAPDPALFKQRCYVGGHWIMADSGGVIAVVNPATEEIIGHVPDCGSEETTKAIAIAQAAFKTWRQTPAETRGRLLRKWADLIMAASDGLAHILTLEQGKPLAEAKAEIHYAVSYIEWFAEESRRLNGDIIPSPWPDRELRVYKEPVGVCAAITPWNFPAAMITRKVAPALAAGCTIIVKPAEQTPFTALALAQLAHEAGIPSGVLNVITGKSRGIGGVLTASQTVRKLTFTGSTEVGRLLAAQCAPTLKHLSLELGGNAPFIVFEDANLDEAVIGALGSKYRNSGQTCVCTNRILVHKAVLKDFSSRLAHAVERLKVGNGLAPEIEQGPLIDLPALQKIEILLADALGQGATLLCGGKRHALGGTFFEPTVIAGVNRHMRMANEEIFGPIAAIYEFETEEQAIQMANDTEFGLAAYFYTENHRRIRRVAAALEYGMVGVNTGLISTAVAPFGGVKQSGLGREGSRYGIEGYLETKYLCVA